MPFGIGDGVIGLTFAPGKQQDGMTGAHRRDLDVDLDAVAAWNAALVLTLVEGHELESLRIADIGAAVRRRHMEWHHWPIGDYQVPDAAFMAEWPGRSAMLRGLLARGGRVLVHCKGGLGRAGSVAARLLVEGGMPPHEAIAAVRAVRPGAIETGQQEAWVAAGRPASLPEPDRSRIAARDRAIGALLGLAVGDALGAAIEFEPKPRYARLDDLRAGGPHRLTRGQWTDDTAMALALAESLRVDPGLDATDLMRRFVDWSDNGAYSCTGTCFDIGIQTRAALERFRRTGNPLAGSEDEAASGNGALMRLAPVAIRHFRDRDALARVAALQTRTTHGSRSTLVASGAFATMLADAIEGTELGAILSGPAAGDIAWRGLHRDAIEGTGYVVRSLQAAVWAVARTTNFRSAVLLAANLGQDADTTAAIAGQLAGAVYEIDGIPPEWREAVAWRDRLTAAAEALFDAGWPDDDVWGEPAEWMTATWSLREQLEALAAFRPVFEQEGFVFATWVPGHSEGELNVFGWCNHGAEASRFQQMLYQYGWVRMFDYSEWQSRPEGQRLLENPAALGNASADDLVRILTTCVRNDRFCEGALLHRFETGLITRVVLRAEALLRAM